jgi:glycogen phosphorylase
MTSQQFIMEVHATLPDRIRRLQELAANLRFSWHRPTRQLFERLDPELWRSVSGNPRLFLRWVDQATLDKAATDEHFLAAYGRALRSFDEYQKGPVPGTFPLLPPGQLVAYFCAEYGFHESFPIYSGGLGILAGDHCKTASDVGLEFVAVGLLYRQGYFTQSLDADGNQVASYHDSSHRDLPVTAADDGTGRALRVTVQIADRAVQAQIWCAEAGRTRVVLLDTNVPENSESDREITYKLYGGDRVVRIQQEMILGLGGVKALRALKLAPAVFHMNEGHAAFLGLELLRERIEAGVSFAAAREAVAAGSVFTTHTPVAAGHDAFAADIVLAHFADYVRRFGISGAEFLALGKSSPNADYDMTTLALTLSRRQNGVSRVHGAVSARICAQLWPEVPPIDNPLGYVTNGVHVPTFLSQRWKELFDRHYGEDWRVELSNEAFWARLYELSDEEFWSVRQTVKSSMLVMVRARLWRESQRNRTSEAHYQRLVRLVDPDQPQVLTIGFARRFATYKRATLLFRDRGWLESIVSDPERPVVFIFAGKAHPADQPGQALLHEITALARSADFFGRVLFLTDYDIGVARSLAAGVDVWLNTPVPPLEASGTSGMKAGINGAINLSVPDGWWAEGYDGQNGWSIPSSDTDDGKRDEEDARSLCEVLQDQVVPLYYERDASGLPRRWIAKAKRSMATVLPSFNTRRMLANYVTGLYAPAAAHGQLLSADQCRAGAELAAWKARAVAAWPGIRLRLASERPQKTLFGDRFEMRVAVNLNGLEPGDLRLELLLTRELPMREVEAPRFTSFGAGAEGVRVREDHQAYIGLFVPAEASEPDGARIYTMTCTPPWPGQLSAQVRAVPYHTHLSHPYELGLMRWL